MEPPPKTRRQEEEKKNPRRGATGWGGIKGSLNALNNALAAHTNIKKKRREEERESAREKIELNSLILNYYLSIMGGMEPGCCAGED